MAAISTAEQNLATLEARAAGQDNLLDDLVQAFSQVDSTVPLAEALQQQDLARATEALTSAGNDLAANLEAAQRLLDTLRQAAQAAANAGDFNRAAALNQVADALAQACEQGGNGPAMQQALAQALVQAGPQLATQQRLDDLLANIQRARQQLAQANGLPGSIPQAGLTPQPGRNPGGAGREDPEFSADGLLTTENAPDSMSTDNGPNEGRVEAYESLYSPDHLGGEGGPVVKPDSPQVAGGVPVGDAPVDPNQDPGPVLVPYNQIYGQYADTAGQALDNNYSPLGLKGYVRQYFGALEPGE
jgi:hypothetical protein